MTKAVSTKAVSALAAGFGALALCLAVSAASPAQAAKAKAERSAISKECSVKANEQKLHGKERRKFRSQCMRDAKKKAT